MGLLVFLKALRFRFFLFFRRIIFVSSFCLLSPVVYGEDGQNFPVLPLEEPSPQLLLPLDDLIPDSSPSTPTDRDLKATILEDFKTTHRHISKDEKRKQIEIARLLKELKSCANVNKAKTISQQIQRLWSQSGSDTIDLLMSWAESAISSENYGLALDYIDNVIALLPNYAEVWIRRAWVHIQLSDFKLAMLDLNHAIELEPRNYMAFFELGITMEATERPQLAIKAYEKALYYYPQMQKLQKRIEFLLDKQSPQTL
ncbi:tetratricopeptide repeat protein [Bartonella sp. CB175]|uniref:tetratricopeptide repeat protein n=1 Tax=Bartonella sp. CB175 TaxID=3112256 RepID=UPI00300DC5E8